MVRYQGVFTKTEIPKPTFKQLEKALNGELMELIPSKKGFCIYIYPDMKHFRYISLN